MNKQFVCKISDLKDKVGFRFETEEIAIFKIENEFFAVSNICAHQKFAKIFEGECKDFSVTCPMHHWKFDLRSGNSLSGNGKLKTFPVVVEDNKIFIELE
ncbi:MAG: Rieske (2Fe-2S) protein [Bacteroidota bacterium]